mmetsp:Transcript_25143/g.44034  ORF Transcript_25143/g.44034 Transcript_25143/m.44034 type:complete len:867 (+) Transcript_25143:200-2800(+)
MDENKVRTANNEEAVDPVDRMEQAVPETVPIEERKENMMEDASETPSKARKTYLFMGVILVVAAVAIVVALVPDWGKSGSTTTSSLASDGLPDNGTNGEHNGNSSSTGSTKSESEAPLAGEEPTFFESSEGPFEFKIPLLSSNVTETYRSVEEARHDIEQLARLIVNRQILQGMENDDWFGPPIAATTSEVAADSTANGDKGQSESASSAFAGTDDFETYQQEAGVVRSDYVKSNGVHVFAAVQDRILVWDVQGNLRKTVTMPPLNLTNGGKPPLPVEPLPIAEAKSSIWWNPKPYIQGMLLSPDGARLTVIVGGYGGEYTAKEKTIPIIYELKGTRVIVYDIGDDGILTEVSRTDIDGNHLNSYSVENNVHIVTKAGLNTWEHLVSPIQRWSQEFYGMTAEEYKVAATVKAQALIPDFVQKVLDLVTVDGQIILSHLAVFADSISADEQTSIQAFGGDVANSLTQVYSFDMSKASTISDLSLSKSATLQPGYWGYVYATNDWIWVADQGWRWIEEENTYAQDTVLLGFKLNGPSTDFAVYGSVPGSLLNQFSIDFYKDQKTETSYVRVATTLNFWWGGWWGVPQEADDDSSRTKNQVIIMELPPQDDSVIQLDNKLIRRGSVQLGKKDESITAVRFFDNISYVVTFERTDPFYVLDLTNPMSPVVLGELEIPGFSQFMHPIKDDNSILITVGQDADENGQILGFQISLFDSVNRTSPKLMDRFVIENDENQWSGSSASWDERAFRYLQVGDLGRLIVPVSVYPTWDESGNRVGEEFQGFMFFGVDLAKAENIITKEMEIDHTSQPYDYTSGECYCYSQLPERSMVFAGDVMTMKNQKVISTDLVNRNREWNITLDDSLNCCNEDL